MPRSGIYQLPIVQVIKNQRGHLQSLLFMALVNQGMISKIISFVFN